MSTPLTADELSRVQTHRRYLNASILISSLPSLIMLLMIYNGSAIHREFVVVLLMGAGIFTFVRWRYWRCPRCARRLQNDPRARACGQCGVLLVPAEN